MVLLYAVERMYRVKIKYFGGSFPDGGDRKNVTVEQCKTYLREQGLRSSGTKNVLIERIIAHIK